MCRKVVALFRKKIVTIDNESYTPLSSTNLSGNAGYYTSDPNTTPNEVKLKRKSKYEPKLLVWVALSKKGVSKHYIAPLGQAVDKEVYISKYLVKLKKFINKVHKNDKIVFWADLASTHYSNKVQDYLKDYLKNIEYVPRDKNPADVPELCSIKGFGAEIKRLVYADNWQAENLHQLRNRIDYCMKKIDQNHVYRLGASTFIRVDCVRQNGLINK